MHRFTPAAVATAMLAAGSISPALAHITLATGKAPADSFYKAVLRVGHGCDGSATRTIRVQIPEGVMQAKPMPKAGWKLETVVKPLAQPYDYDGAKITKDVREIVWSGGDLPDAFYDEFAFRAKLPDEPGKVLSFPVVQECQKGVNRWIEIPTPGKDADDYEEPAPQLTLTPKEASSDD